MPFEPRVELEDIVMKDDNGLAVEDHALDFLSRKDLVALVYPLLVATGCWRLRTLASGSGCHGDCCRCDSMSRIVRYFLARAIAIDSSAASKERQIIPNSIEFQAPSSDTVGMSRPVWRLTDELMCEKEKIMKDDKPQPRSIDEAGEGR